MLAVRIIPCLDVDLGRVVKGIKFKELKGVGDPVELAKFYNAQGADELVFLDVGASHKARKILIQVVKDVAKKVFIPLTIGGGIRSVEDIRKVLNAGADKVAICTEAIENPNLISEGAKAFGSQCIVVSVDAKRDKNTWHAYTHGGRYDSGLDILEWVKTCESLGAGEILLNSIDMDGTKQGYDLELTRLVSGAVKVPVIASGGAGNLQQIFEAIKFGKADAVLLASLLHYEELTIPQIKDYLQKNGARVRW